MPEESAIVAAPKRRVFFYVDGFNLYYRKLKPAPALRWLNIRKMAEKYIYGNDLVASVKFFTALVDANHVASDKRDRQMLYWRVLEAHGVSVVKGCLEERSRKCNSHNCGQYLTFTDMCEKRSDVNLALHMLRDYVKHQPDVVAVISADTDVIPALEMLKQEAKDLRKKIELTVFLPCEDKNMYYSRVENFGGIARIRQINAEWLANSQFQSTVTLPGGANAIRPASWA